MDPTAVLATGKHATASLLAAAGRDLDGFLDRVCTVERLPALDAALVPVLHPSYEAVWRARLGYPDAAAYRADAASALRQAGVSDVASPKAAGGERT